jgi:amidophosphoribosyltransferase
MDLETLGKYLGATSLGYLSIEGAVAAVGRGSDSFCLACFNGEYKIPVPQDMTKHAFDDPPEVGEMAAVGPHGQLTLIE